MLGLNRSNIVTPFMSLTSYGKKVLDNEDVVPHDPENYIKTFKNKVPDADELILMYLTESVQTFRNNNLLAASVMLGVASEASFNLLFQEFTNSVTGPKKDKFEKLLSNISTKQKFDELIKEIALIKNRLPIELQENLQSELNGIFNLIKYQRNDSGHPTGKKLSRDEVFVSLRLFIIYCGKVYRLIDWLKNNTI